MKKKRPDPPAPERATSLTPHEREVLRAARQHARLTNASMWDVSSQIVAMTSGDLAARKIAERIGATWPELPSYLFSAWPPPFSATFLPKLFTEQRWGDLLVAAVEAGAGTAHADLLASPVVRILLGLARDGLRDGRPEFEEVARRLAAVLAPPPRQGRRTRRSITEEERLAHADFLYRAFKVLVDWTRAQRPRRLSGPALVAHLQKETGGQRAYWPALGRAGYLVGARLVYEDELLPYVVEAVETAGKRSSATNAAFHRFALAYGFAPAGSTPAGYLRAMRQAVHDIRYRKQLISKPLPYPGTLLLPSAERAGRKRETHDAEAQPQPPRPQQAEARRPTPRLPSGRPPAPRRDQPERPPEHDRRRDPPRRQARPRRPRPSG